MNAKTMAKSLKNPTTCRRILFVSHPLDRSKRSFNEVALIPASRADSRVRLE